MSSMGVMPDGTTYGTIVGDFSILLPDSEDSDDAPDLQPLHGVVTVKPSVVYFIHTTTRKFILAPTETYPIKQDGTCSFKVVATDSPNLNPPGWKYNVSIMLENFDPINLDITVPSNSTVSLVDALAQRQ